VVTFVADYPCRAQTPPKYIRVKVYVTDGGGNPISDANVTVQISGGESGTLTSLGGGYYGGAGGSCWISNYEYPNDKDVTVTAVKAGYTNGVVTANTGSTPSCSECP
jgi:hypothetical protein